MLAVKSVIGGRRSISPGIADGVMEGFIEGRKKLKRETTWDTVTY
jgi:hypothetical protein